MIDRLDKGFFQELNGMNVDGVCRRALCVYNEMKKAYEVEAWGDIYEVFPEISEIKSLKNDPVNLETALVIIFYLLRAREKLIKGEWISEKDIPGGVAFFTGPHAIPSHFITKAFGNDLERFKRACRGLGGDETEMGDAGFIFRILKRVPVAILMWHGDDEFGPDAKILYDRTIYEHLPVDVIFGLSHEILRRISVYRN